MLAAVKLPEQADSLPAIWNVPLQRNPNFVGRDADLTELHFTLTGADAAGRVRVIHGMAGVGKTSLVAEYVHRRRGDYNLIWWIRADSASAMAAFLAALAPKLGMAGALDAADLPDVCEAVRRELDKRDGWLLVFDNAASPEEVEPFLPVQRRGHVIITSRSPNWRRLARALPLRPWDRADAITYLRMRSGRKDNDLDAARICQALGDLPLALEQAAAMIERARISFAAYLSRFETHWGDLFRQGGGGGRGDSASVVAMAWELSMRQVAATNPAAIELITFCAFVHPDAIERRFLRQCAAALPEPLASLVQSATALDEAIAALLDYSLIESNELAISLHRLVASQARERLSAEQKTHWAAIAVRAAASAFAFDSQDTATWRPSAAILPHALAATANAEEAGGAAEVTVGLMDVIGRYLICRGQFEEAKRILIRALDLAAQTYGASHPRVSMVCNNLGRVHQKLEELEDARLNFERSLAIDKVVYGANDLRTAAVANNYGICLLAAGKPQLAQEQFEHALAVYQRQYGIDHLKVVPVINNLAYVLLSIGQIEQSVAQFQRALAIAQAGHGTQHPTVACILSNLGVAQRAQGNTAAARRSLEKAAAIDELVHGPQHPDVARDLGHLGKVFQDAGDFGQAKAKLQRALEIDEAAFGKDHPEVIYRWHDLGRLHKAMNDVDSAVRCFEKALEIAKSSGQRRGDSMVGQDFRAVDV